MLDHAPEIALLLIAAALFIAVLTLLAYVCYRFFTVAISLDAHILREMQARPAVTASLPSTTSESILGGQLKDFIAARMKPTDGAFEFSTDEDLFLQETVANLRSQGISEDELDAFMKHAATEKPAG